jgi:hypothetical protein
VEGTSRAAIEDGDIICLQHSHPRIVPQTPFSLSTYQHNNSGYTISIYHYQK